MGTMDVSTQHDHLLNSWLGIANSGYRKIHDYHSVFDGVAIEMTDDQVVNPKTLTSPSYHHALELLKITQSPN